MLIVTVHGVGLGHLEAVTPASEPQAFIQECLDAGFNTTWIWDYSERVITETVTKSFLVTDATSENVTIGIVHRAASGTLQVRLDGPDGPLVMLDRRALDAEVTLELPRGEYSLSLSWRDAGNGGTACCMDGPIVWARTPPDTITEHPARPAAGFSWPYLLHVPKGSPPTRLLVVPNNTGTPSDWERYHLESARKTVIDTSRWTDVLGVAILTPVFPRPRSDWEVYTHALDRDVLTTDDPRLGRLDLQLGAMIEDAREVLAARDIAVEKKVLMFGFSASAMFVNRFTVLHPGRVAAAAMVSPGGWPLAPLETYGGVSLAYPVGTADLTALTGEPVDRNALGEVSMLFLLGGRDDNDSVRYRDGYDLEQEQRIRRLFGETPLERWPEARTLYALAGCNATFLTFPSAGHELTEAMREAVLEHFSTGTVGLR